MLLRPVRTVSFPDGGRACNDLPMLELRLVGNDVGRSPSPKIHRVLLEMGGLVGNYEAISCDLDGAIAAFDALRHGELGGVNVTMPFKGHAADYCDWLTEDARSSNSVNTMFPTDGEIHGASSDAAAMAALRSRFADLDQVLVLGAGGAAAAAAHALVDRDLFVSARRQEEAERLAQRFGSRVIPWGNGVQGSLLVNATPIGALGEELAEAVVGDAAGAVDLAYSAEPTPLTVRLRDANRDVVDGHQFLVMQAIKSFEWWTGVHVEFEDVWAAL